MTAHDPSLHQTPATRADRQGFFGWLRGERREDEPPSQVAEAREHDDPRRIAQRQLITDLGDFLLGHDLDITPFTLNVAFNYLTGSDGRLMRRIEERLAAREPLTMDWLDNIARERADPGEDLGILMNQLETNIHAFENTSSAAKSAASSYNSALSAHVDDLGRSMAPQHEASDMVQEIVGLARAMCERTAALEQDMTRSVLETRALRRSLEMARRNAEEDHLTGLANRRAFEARYASEYATAREAGEQLAVAFCDIDNFKRVNDEHGHEAGDRILKTVATALAKISDDRCHVARHGGEEFVVLLRGRSLHQAWELLDDARAGMAERRMVNRANDTPFGKVTFSGGIADVFAFADPRAALRAADRALFRAKAEGRNKVLVADPATDTGESKRR
jgi:diguanylate cyclase